MPRYIVITPVRDEAEHIGRTIDAMASQSVLPHLWIVVDDGSTDGTAQELDERARDLRWLRVIHRADRGRRANGGGVMEAFHDGLAMLPDEPWEYLVKLDGDLSFPVDYFERCLAKFAAESRLGIGGGLVCRLVNGESRIDSTGDPAFHVRGATKIYRRDCWNAIAPLPRTTGWDTIDEVHANLLGWRTRTFDDITLLQHKPTGGADGALRNAFKNGRADYGSGYHPAFMMAKCVRRMLRQPWVLGAAALLAGYLTGYAMRAPRAAGPSVVAYLRNQQLRRLLGRPSIYA